MKETELKPCPFCKGVAELHQRLHFEEFADKKSDIPNGAKFLYEKTYPKYKRYAYKRIIYIPRCTDTSCVGRTTKIFFDKQTAITAWNRRADNEQREAD